MSLISNCLAVVLGEVCFAAAALAQQPYSWVNNPPPVEVFAPAFEKLWVASYERPAFRSIKGELIPEDGTFSTLAQLLGMSKCWLHQRPTQDEARLLMLVHTSIGPYWSYQCRLEAGTEAQKGYSNLVKAVEKSRPDWKVSPNGGRSVVFSLENDIPISVGPGITSPREVSVEKGEASVDLKITGQIITVDSTESGGNGLYRPSSASAIDDEIASVIHGGRYFALPSPGTAKSTTPGFTTLVITNGTQYSLQILSSGPTKGQYTISPGAMQEIVVSPGSYKIVGRVSAPNVLPFYGTETYAGGSKYSYRFYVQ